MRPHVRVDQILNNITQMVFGPYFLWKKSKVTGWITNKDETYFNKPIGLKARKNILKKEKGQKHCSVPLPGTNFRELLKHQKMVYLHDCHVNMTGIHSLVVACLA